jgi:hypothetical protein
LAQRTIVKRRIGPDGVDVDCESEPAKYFDLKDHKKATYKQGRGEHYRKTVYTHRENSTRRVYEDEPLRVENPQDESQYIDYESGVIKYYWIEAGRGEHYQRTRVRFDNTEQNTVRRVRTQRVENVDEDGNGGNGNYIEVERIENFTLQHSRGAAFQGKRVHPTNTEEQIEAMEGDCKEL